MNFNSIENGDCLALIKEIPDNSIDLTFADPPFNLKKKYKTYKDDRIANTYLEWCHEWLNEMVRVTKPSGSIFVHHVPQWLIHLGAHLSTISEVKHWISWEARSAPRGNGLLPNHYGILYCVKSKEEAKFYPLRHPHRRCRICGGMLKDFGGKKDRMHPFGPLVSDVWTDLFRITHSSQREEHPCQLPMTVMERLILLATDTNDVVLDLFSGTGTTLVAAKKLGRKYIGYEIDAEYVSLITTRLKRQTNSSKLGASWVSMHRDEIVTLRDRDWNDIKKHFVIPKDQREIDKKKIGLECNQYDHVQETLWHDQ